MQRAEECVDRSLIRVVIPLLERLCLGGYEGNVPELGAPLNGVTAVDNTMYNRVMIVLTGSGLDKGS
jgi:hypothetical protein